MVRSYTVGRGVRWSLFGWLSVLLLLLAPLDEAAAQTEESDLKTFGYFQTNLEFSRRTQYDPPKNISTFYVPQLNLIIQKDLASGLTSFVNFEVLNSFSSEQRWGAFNLAEAWVRYRYDRRLSVKVGLSIPVFNNLNEIKNRAPLLPYIVRPLVYEASFGEFISIEEFVPRRAFLQVYGFFPKDDLKFDYAVYAGNSPNINNDAGLGQTGVDTTAALLLGGRLGIRLTGFKAGVSLTRDRVNSFKSFYPYFGGDPDLFENVPRVRLGLDGSTQIGRMSAEGEFIQVFYDDDLSEFHAVRLFYYATLGFLPTDRLFTYVSHWVSREEWQAYAPAAFLSLRADTFVPNIGAAYALNERLTVKAQFARAHVRILPAGQRHQQWYATFALSVFF